MAAYNTIPSITEEDAPLTAPKPAASRKSTAIVAAICLASAVAGFKAPSAVGALVNFATDPMGKPTTSEKVQICMRGKNFCLGMPSKGDNGLGEVQLYKKSNNLSQGNQVFTYDMWNLKVGGNDGRDNTFRLRFMSGNGQHNGCLALEARTGKYSKGGSPIILEECRQYNVGGSTQRQEAQIDKKKRLVAFDPVVNLNLYIGGPEEKPENGDGIFSDQGSQEWDFIYL